MINGSIFHIPLKNKSVHTIIYSPPYFGLRDYGLDPILIGGKLDCVHEWGSELQVDKQHQWKPGHGGLQDNQVRAGAHKRFNGSFCLNCNAWRGLLGLEPTPELFIEHCKIYARECWRVLRDDGTMWANIGSSYSGSWGSQSHDPEGKAKRAGYNTRQPTSYPHAVYKSKDLIPTPWLFAIALQQDGWYLRSDIIWQKPNPMPESVTDRPTRSHEYVFLFSKSKRYFYDADAVREKLTQSSISRLSQDIENQIGTTRANGGMKTNGNFKAVGNPAGRNLRSVWSIPTHGFSEAHFATFPPKLIEPMVKAGTSEGGVCVECGSQFERVVNTSYSNPGNRSTNGPRSKSQRHESLGFDVRLEKTNHTLGFRPTCTHYDHLEYDRSDPDWIAPLNWPTDKAIVLDPFGGAGTTQLVATRLGRQGVSIELSPEYCRMGRDRTRDDIPPMMELIDRTVDALQKPQQAALFDG